MDKTVFISGPAPTLEIIYSGVWLSGVFSRRFLCFELPNESPYNKAIEAIVRGLKFPFQGTTELGGISVLIRAEREGGDSWRANWPHEGIELFVNDLRSSYKSFKRLRTARFWTRSRHGQAFFDEGYKSDWIIW